jgi:cephalosporin-C deacetylase-like acetyl esterase
MKILRVDMHVWSFGVLHILFLFTQQSALAQSQPDFLSDLAEARNLRQMLPNHVNGLARADLAARAGKIALLTSPEALQARKQYVRERILSSLGSLPERTPLNVRAVGTLERPDYRIEKFIFESQPRFYVPAHLYVPRRGTPPYPAILFPLGHEFDTKARPLWQLFLGTLATRGYVVLTYDPVGQGERIQLYDPDWGESKVFRNNTEHTILGIQCLLIGDNLARYSVWDGMRALDYLLSRPEVDAKRIACTGNSGGGNITAFLAALDDRIQVAAPSCWINSWQSLLETIGQQDAEQVLIPSLQDGLDHGDFIYAFAPKPYLILSAIRDFFAVKGVRETYDEARRIYAMLGVEEKLHKAEADAGHDYSKPLRMAAYRWFGRWLRGAEDNAPEVDLPLATEEEMRCTPSGQIETSLGGETVRSMNQKRVAALGRKLPALTVVADVNSFRERTRQQVSRLLNQGALPLKDRRVLKTRSYGQITRSGYSIEKLTYESEPGILIPALLFLPEGSPTRKPAVVYVDARGKSAESGPGQDLEQLAKAGFAVLAIDVRGMGETEVLESEQASDVRPYFGDYDSAMTALVVGKPLVGMRALDISRGVDLLQAREDVDPDHIVAFGRRNGAVSVLYAAVVDERLKKIVLEGMLESYQTIVDQKIHRQVFESVVSSVLRFYDLPDLVAALAPREVWMVNSVDAMGHAVRSQQAESTYAFAKQAFRLAGQPDRLHLRNRGAETILQAYRELVTSR